MVSALDDSIGGLDELDRLDRSRIPDLFQSDNGPSIEKRNLLNDSGDTYKGSSAGPLRGYKGSLFEGGIRVPAIMSWKGVIPEGIIRDEIGVTMDIFPTLLKLAGGELPQDRVIDGTDIFPMITQQAASPHREIYWSIGKQRAVRSGDWKLITSPSQGLDGKAEGDLLLFNLKDDPYEERNLAQEQSDRVEELHKQIQRWEEDVKRRS